jgi:predicted enzyme related to lactoylglutathione lyase
MILDPRRLCQIEIQVTDMTTALTFYEGVFGWRRVPADIYNFMVLEVPEDCPFGISLILKRKGTEVGKALVPYIATDDPEAIATRAVVHGGRMVLKKILPYYGSILQISDPDGHLWGLFRGK